MNEADDELVVATPEGVFENARWGRVLNLALSRLLVVVGPNPKVAWESYRLGSTVIILLTLSSGGDLHHVSINVLGYTDIPAAPEAPFDYGVRDMTDALFVMSKMLLRLNVDSLPLTSF